MALVMAVAAVDSYMHGIVIRRIGHVRRRGDLPKRLSQQQIPFSDLADLADGTIEAQRERRRARPWVQVKASLQKQLLRATFQSYEQVGSAFAMAGIERGWSKVASELNETAAAIQVRLDALVHRRNQIVHEGDLKRASRPQKLRFNSISTVRAKRDVDWVASLIDAMGKVVANNP